MPRSKVARQDKTTPPAAGAAPSLRDEARAMYREAVLRAAEQVFSEQGVHGARIQDIAKLARVSVGTVYNHFAQKEDIVVALLELRQREFLEAYAPRDDDPHNFEGLFRARNERMIKLICKHRAFFALALFEGILDSDRVPMHSLFAGHEQVLEQHFPALFEKMLLQGMQEGAIERQDPVRLKYFIGGAFRGVLLAALSNPEADPTEEGRFVCELCLRAMRPIGTPQPKPAPRSKPRKGSGR